MFVIVLKYVKSLEEVEKQIPPHVEFLDKYYASSQFICSGPRIPWTGGLILANVDSMKTVQSIIMDDPFYIHGIAEFEIIEFDPWKYDKRFSCFLEPEKA